MGSGIEIVGFSDRRPESCDFRRIEEASGERRAFCELAHRFVDDTGEAEFQVDGHTCEACCKYPLPDGPRLNPVVASLVVGAAHRALTQSNLAARDFVALHQSRQFAMRWLATGHDEELPSVVSRFEVATSGSCDERQVPLASKVSRGRSPAAHPLRIGLVGRNSSFGLGHQNRDIAVHLGIERWLIPRTAECHDGPPRQFPCRVDFLSPNARSRELAEWLAGLDIVLFVESPEFSGLTSVARSLGVRVVCVPNWEWLQAGLDWLDDVDLMLCPTDYTASLLLDWKRRFRFTWEIETLPWPVNTARFRFQQRSVCRRLVFVNGSGGVPAVAHDNSKIVFRRKGLEVLLAAARLVPNIPIIVYALADDVRCATSNVEVRRPPTDNSLLYCDGDVCVQPSHWEGLGLPLLECQAAGMPLITTDLPPMNEHQPLAVIPAVEEAVYLGHDYCIPAAKIAPEDLAGVMRTIHGRRIAHASKRARRFVERWHSWSVARSEMLRILAALVAGDRGAGRALSLST